MGTLAPKHFAGKDTDSGTAKHGPDVETQHSAQPKICIYGDSMNGWSLGTANNCVVSVSSGHTKGKLTSLRKRQHRTVTSHHVSLCLTFVKISYRSSFCMAPGMDNAHSLFC